MDERESDLSAYWSVIFLHMTNEPTHQAALPAHAAGEPPAGYAELLRDIKKEVAATQVRAQRLVNTQMIEMYWRIGRLIVERQEKEQWPTSAVPRLSADLREAYAGQTGFGHSNLDLMLRRTDGKLPWGQIKVLFDRVRAAAVPGRADPCHPYGPGRRRAEYIVEEAFVRRTVTYLVELGFGFAYVGRQFAIECGAPEFCPELLFYHLQLSRYVVIELRTDAPEPAHLGQLGFYAALIDDKVRNPEQDEPTLGILITKNRKHESVEYALRAATRPLSVSVYENLPPAMREFLPSAEDLSRIVDDVLDGAALEDAEECDEPDYGVDESSGGISIACG